MRFTFKFGIVDIMNNESLSKWTSISEMTAAIGVILSLVFVGLQINEGNRETRAAILQSANDSEMFMQSQLMRYADVWQKIISGNPLEDGAELRTGVVLYKMVMTEYENRFAQFEAGYFDATLWATRRSALERTVAVPFFETWRASIGAAGHSPNFLELIDNIKEHQR